MYDVIVVGGGPSGLTAAIYASRYGKKVVVYEKNICGGQINNSPMVDNIPGFLHIPGSEFAMQLATQAEELGVDIVYEEVTNVYREDDETFGVEHWDGYDFIYDYCKSVIIAVGCKPRMLGLEREEELIGNGIHTCSTCDGMFYKNKNVAVIGGGNSALVEAIELAKICKKVTIIQNLATLTADQTLVDEFNSFDNTEVILGAIVTSYNFDYDNKFKGLSYKYINNPENEDVTGEMWCDGIFMCIGQVPNTDFLKDNTIITTYDGYIYDCKDDRIMAAGDCLSQLKWFYPLKQVVTACASGAEAAFALNQVLKAE